MGGEERAWVGDKSFDGGKACSSVNPLILSAFTRQYSMLKVTV
jgi:hypothetical protein